MYLTLIKEHKESCVKKAIRQDELLQLILEGGIDGKKRRGIPGLGLLNEILRKVPTKASREVFGNEAMVGNCSGTDAQNFLFTVLSRKKPERQSLSFAIFISGDFTSFSK